MEKEEFSMAFNGRVAIVMGASSGLARVFPSFMPGKVRTDASKLPDCESMVRTTLEK